MTPTFRRVAFDDPVVDTLMADYRQELAGFGIALGEEEPGAVDATELGPPSGTFLVVEDAGAPVGCGGLRTLSRAVGEIKRMYVTPGARGRGIGTALLGELEADARARGCVVVRLDTGPGMAAALGLYRSSGYREIADYNGNPHAAHWFEKRL